MQNTYRLPVRNAPPLTAVQAEKVEADRLPFGACFMIWMGLIASTWAAIALVFSFL